MRFVLALVAAALLAPSVIAVEEPRPLAVSIFTVGEAGALVTWTPAPGVLSYTIYRGTDPDNGEIIGHSTTTAFLDADSPRGEVWYIVTGVVADAPDPIDTEYRGACVKHKGTTGMSIAVSNCVPLVI